MQSTHFWHTLTERNRQTKKNIERAALGRVETLTLALTQEGY
jgi:hypothetical protein